MSIRMLLFRTLSVVTHSKDFWGRGLCTFVCVVGIFIIYGIYVSAFYVLLILVRSICPFIISDLVLAKTRIESFTHHTELLMGNTYRLLILRRTEK